MAESKAGDEEENLRLEGQMEIEATMTVKVEHPKPHARGTMNSTQRAGLRKEMKWTEPTINR